MAKNFKNPNPYKESGALELIGINSTEVSSAGDYSNSVSFSFDTSQSGAIQSLALFSTEAGTGAVQRGHGLVIFFDADPAVAAGDTTLAVAEYPTIVGSVDVSVDDWVVDTNGAFAFFNNIDIPYHDVKTLYVVYKNTDSTAVWNSAAGDDEALNINVWTQASLT